MSRHKKKTRVEKWLAGYTHRYHRYLRRYHRVLRPDDPIRSDMRFWEAKVCKVNPHEFCQMFWFFPLHPINRFEIYRVTRNVRWIDRTH